MVVKVKAYNGIPNGIRKAGSLSREVAPSVAPSTLKRVFAAFVDDANIATLKTNVATNVNDRAAAAP